MSVCECVRSSLFPFVCCHRSADGSRHRLVGSFVSHTFIAAGSITPFRCHHSHHTPHTQQSQIQLINSHFLLCCPFAVCRLHLCSLNFQFLPPRDRSE